MTNNDVIELSQDDQLDWALERFSDAALEVGELALSRAKVSPDKSKDSLLLIYLGQAKTLFPFFLVSVDAFLHDCKRLCTAGWAGHAPQIHALQSQFRVSFHTKMRLIGDAQRIAGICETACGEAPPEGVLLANARQKLERFRVEVVERWQTLEDVEDILAETYPLSTEELEAAAKRHGPPPQSWYDEDSKPFDKRRTVIRI